MTGKFSFTLRSQDNRRRLPSKIIIGCRETETIYHVGLKLIAFVYFFRERLQIEADLQNDNIPFTPDLAQMDYEMRPILWIECGECTVNKLDKLAVKVPEAEIWIVKRSLSAAASLMKGMAREELRANRYNVLALDEQAFEELCSRIAGRNEFVWYKATAEPPNPDFAGRPHADDAEPEMHFELNGLWFQLPFHILKF